ncbi:hypothetical protein EYF80_029954 [Liparis tanakae]|uniref:Uncharacterized protein n=1 Tax=Liparis tanakae TaxID=230148 RepID=A0A4Z2H1X2_9TELE|nr:hypothetical protein EYF80_029954 [Liparis tanakae]
MRVQQRMKKAGWNERWSMKKKRELRKRSHLKKQTREALPSGQQDVRSTAEVNASKLFLLSVIVEMSERPTVDHTVGCTQQGEDLRDRDGR